MKEAWIQTFTGKKVHPFDLKMDQVCIEDIAHGLAMTCRYNGQCQKFYSVAEHSLRMADNVTEYYYGKGIYSDDEARLLALECLLHDAAEAYMGDMVRPIKSLLWIAPDTAAGDIWRSFKEMENKAMRVIRLALGLDADCRFKNEVHEADMRMLATEKRDINGPEPAPWIELPEPYPRKIVGTYDPHEAELAYLKCFIAVTAGK